MAQFPIALAIEPRLLSYAVANGFYMDTKVGSLRHWGRIYPSFPFSTVTLYSAKCSKNPYQWMTHWLQTLLPTFGSYVGLILRERASVYD
jgi:O-succinylbenzoate synthase